MIIETGRLVLKPHSTTSAERMNKWRNDAELNYYDDEGPELLEKVPLERTQRYLERITHSEDDSIIRFAIHLKEGDSLIGTCMIALIDHYNRSCKLGISIGEKGEWGKGYGREAVSALIRICFNELNLNRIGAEIYAFNLRSLRLFQNAGFVREGVTRQAVFKRGCFEDAVQLGLLKREWNEAADKL